MIVRQGSPQGSVFKIIEIIAENCIRGNTNIHACRIPHGLWIKMLQESMDRRHDWAGPDRWAHWKRGHGRLRAHSRWSYGSGQIFLPDLKGVGVDGGMVETLPYRRETNRRTGRADLYKKVSQKPENRAISSDAISCVSGY